MNALRDEILFGMQRYEKSGLSSYSWTEHNCKAYLCILLFVLLCHDLQGLDIHYHLLTQVFESNVRCLNVHVNTLHCLQKSLTHKNQIQNYCSTAPDKPRNCLDLMCKNETSGSGVYQVYPSSDASDVGYSVFCDQDTEGGGWMVSVQIHSHVSQRLVVQALFCCLTGLFAMRNYYIL